MKASVNNRPEYLRNYLNENPVLGSYENVREKYESSGYYAEFEAKFEDYVPGWAIKKAWSYCSKDDCFRYLVMPIAEFNREVEKYL